jgi:hypothetical protein
MIIFVTLASLILAGIAAGTFAVSHYLSPRHRAMPCLLAALIVVAGSVAIGYAWAGFDRG